MLIWFVVLYIAVSVGIGLYASRRVKNTADYVVAGHHLPLPFIIATVFATWFGAETVLGVSATFVREGLGGVVADPFGASLCLILVGLFLAQSRGTDKIGAIRAVKLSFEEKQTPTIVRSGELDLPMHGTFWIDPATATPITRPPSTSTFMSSCSTP